MSEDLTMSGMEGEESVDAVKVWEAMTELNKRSLFGRVVINPPSRMSKVSAHQTEETWFFCPTCQRAFLHREKLLEHKREHEAETLLASRTTKENQSHSKNSSFPPLRRSVSHISPNSNNRVRARGTKQDYSNCIKTPNGEYKCRICLHISSNKKTYVTHAHKHQNTRPHRCLQCGVGFNMRSYLQNHIKNSHSLENTFQCEHCSCRLETEKGLKFHEGMYHNKRAFMVQEKISDGMREMSSTAQSPRKSSLAKKAMKPMSVTTGGSSRPRFVLKIKKNAVKTASGRSSSAMWESTTTDSNSAGLKSPEHECHVCHKMLSSTATLKNHLLLHSGERPYLCKHCGIRFRLYCTLYGHIKSAHFGNGTFRCSYCDCAYKTNAVLTAHVKKYHPEY